VKQKTTPTDLCSQFSWSFEISDHFSDEKINKEAKDSGFVKRFRKLLPSSFLRMCSFWSWQDSFPSLSRQCQWLSEKCGIFIREQSLDKRFTKGMVELLQKVMGKIAEIRIEERAAGICAGIFNGCYVFDSTVQQLFAKCEELFKGSGGDASSAAIKIQYGFDVLSGNLLHIISRNGTDPDSGFRI